MTGDVATGPGWELRLGRWQDVLEDVVHDALISDPSFSARTHEGATTVRYDGSEPTVLGFSSLAPDDITEYCWRWGSTPGWTLVCCSHDQIPIWTEQWEGCDRYVFPPITALLMGNTVRMSGDGPASWTTYMIVSRPHGIRRWGSLPGGYHGPPRRGHERRAGIVGGKPLWLMRALVRHYSRRGDLVCDPCAGAGTTLLAAVTEGRRAIGAEVDPETYQLAVARLRRGYTPAMALGED